MARKLKLVFGSEENSGGNDPKENINNAIDQLNKSPLIIDYHLKMILADLEGLSYRNIDEELKLNLLNILKKTLLKPESDFIIQDDAMNRDIDFWVSLSPINYYSLRYIVISVIGIVGCEINDINMQEELINCLKHFIKEDQDVKNKSIAIEALGKIARRTSLTIKKELISLLLDILCQPKEAYTVQKIISALTNIASSGMGIDDVNELIDHFILYFRDEYFLHKSVLYAIEQLWNNFYIKQREDLTIKLLSYLQHDNYHYNNHYVREGIVRFFLEANLNNISLDILTKLTRSLQRLLKREQSSDTIRFAIQAQEKLMCNTDDASLKLEIVKSLIALVNKVKLNYTKFEAIWALLHLKAVDNYLKRVPINSIKRLINRLLKINKNEFGASSVISLLKSIVTNPNFSAFKDKISKSLNDHWSTYSTRGSLLGSAESKNETDDESKAEIIKDDPVKKFEKKLNQMLEPLEIRTHEPNPNYLFSLVQKIVFNQLSEDQVNEIIKTLLDVLENTEDENNRKEAGRGLIEILDHITEEQKGLIFNVMYKLAMNSNNKRLSGTLLCYLRFFTADKYESKIILAIVNQSVSLSENAPTYDAEELLRATINGYFLETEKLTSEIITNFGLINDKTRHYEVLEQCVVLLLKCVKDDKLAIINRLTALQSLIKIAINIDLIVIKKSIFDELKHILKSVNKNQQELLNLTTEGMTSILAELSADERGNAIACYLNNNLNDAINIYQQLIKTGFNLAVVWFELGVMYYQIHVYEEAIKSLSEATRLEPELMLAHYYLACSYLANEQIHLAIVYFDKIKLIDDNYSPVYYHLAIAYEKSGKNDFAIDQLQEALRINPYYLSALEKRAELHYLERNFRLAQADEESIKKIFPEHKDLNKQHIKKLIGLSEKRSFILYYPKSKEVDEFYQWVSQFETNELVIHYETLIIKLIAIFGKTVIENHKRSQKFTLDNLKALTEHPHELRHFVNDFIEFILKQEIYEAYHQGYVLFKSKNNRETNLIKLIEESRINNIFKQEHTDTLLHNLRSTCEVYSIFEFLQKYAGTIDLQDGFTVGLSHDLRKTYDIFINILGLYHWEAVYGIGWIDNTDQFFEYILGTEKPVVFFVPTDIGNEKYKGKVTYEEIEWVATTLKINPKKLKNLILVFDAYNYLPYYILSKKAEKTSLDLDVDDSLNAVIDFLLNYIIPPENHSVRLSIIKQNVQTNYSKNILGYILADLREAITNVTYNPEDQFLIDLKNIIHNFFDFKYIYLLTDRLDDFYQIIKNKFDNAHSKKNKAHIGILLYLMYKLFSTDRYSNYINPLSKYNKVMIEFIENATTNYQWSTFVLAEGEIKKYAQKVFFPSEIPASSEDSPNSNIDSSRPTIIDAVFNNNREELLNLIRLGQDVNKPGGQNRWTALHWAVQLENEEAIDILLKNGADVEAINDDQMSPLSLSLSLSEERNNRKIFDKLNRHQKDVNKAKVKSSYPYNQTISALLGSAHANTNFFKILPNHGNNNNNDLYSNEESQQEQFVIEESLKINKPVVTQHVDIKSDQLEEEPGITLRALEEDTLPVEWSDEENEKSAESDNSPTI